MALLDTVDGKLARVTLTSSKWGNVFDHGIDLVAPPVWWLRLVAWPGCTTPIPWIAWSVWVVLGGHLAGKLHRAGLYLNLQVSRCTSGNAVRLDLPAYHRAAQSEPAHSHPAGVLLGHRPTWLYLAGGVRGSSLCFDHPHDPLYVQAYRSAARTASVIRSWLDGMKRRQPPRMARTSFASYGIVGWRPIREGSDALAGTAASFWRRGSLCCRSLRLPRRRPKTGPARSTRRCADGVLAEPCGPFAADGDDRH